MLSKPRLAHCQCGRLSASISADAAAPQAVACHCHACQRRSGSPFGVIAYYPAADVTISGEAQRFTRTTDHGAQFTNSFCKTCGSTVFVEAAKQPPMIGITVGAFADPAFPSPVRSVWEQSRHEWIALPHGIAHFAKGRTP